MPNLDGTGPWGTGSLGKGLGPCGQGNRRNNRAGRCFGGGFRFHNGFRMQGRRRRFEDNTMDNRNVYPYTRQELEAQKQEIEGQLSWLNEQMHKIKDE